MYYRIIITIKRHNGGKEASNDRMSEMWNFNQIKNK